VSLSFSALLPLLVAARPLVALLTSAEGLLDRSPLDILSGGVGLRINLPSADLGGGGPVRFLASAASSVLLRGRPRFRRWRSGDDFRTRFRGGSDFDSSFRGRPRPRFFALAGADAALLAFFVSGGVLRLGAGVDFALGVVLSRLLVKEDVRGTPARRNEEE
jgi:hypothetical protein